MNCKLQLSAFAMQTMPEVWPDAVQGIISTFQQQNLPHLEVRLSLALEFDHFHSDDNYTFTNFSSTALTDLPNST